MNNTAKIVNDETASIHDEHIFSDELIAKILEAEEDLEKNPDAWITAEQSIKELRKLL